MRLSRKNYIQQYLIIVLLSLTLFYLSTTSTGFKSISFIVNLLLLLWIFYITSGRLKDINWNPWLTILSLIPFFNVYLMFPKGTDGKNQYGEAPHK